MFYEGFVERFMNYVRSTLIGGHLCLTAHGLALPRELIYLIAALTFASASNTDLPILASSVPRHVPLRYWNAPDAVERLFFAM